MKNTKSKFWILFLGIVNNCIHAQFFKHNWSADFSIYQSTYSFGKGEYTTMKAEKSGYFKYFSNVPNVNLGFQKGLKKKDNILLGLRLDLFQYNGKAVYNKYYAMDSFLLKQEYNQLALRIFIDASVKLFSVKRSQFRGMISFLSGYGGLWNKAKVTFFDGKTIAEVFYKDYNIKYKYPPLPFGNMFKFSGIYNKSIKNKWAFNAYTGFSVGLGYSFGLHPAINYTPYNPVINGYKYFDSPQVRRVFLHLGAGLQYQIN